MTLLIKSGNRWSQITIDADKDMAGQGLSNLKELAAGMLHGDLIVKGAGGVLIRVPPGIANTVWTSNGPGNIPSWQPGGTYFNRYYPATIQLNTPTAVSDSPDHVESEPAPVSSAHVETMLDLPADMVKRITPDVSLIAGEVVKTVDHSRDENGPVNSMFDLEKVVDGAVADDGGVQTTETTAAQNATANDITLLPATPALNDAYYFGFDYPWDNLLLNLGTQGVGVWMLSWEYWNGGWVALDGVTDNTLGFTASPGIKTVIFTRPGDWVLTNINGAGNKYWIRARVSVYTSVSQQPTRTQAWCRITT